MQSDLCILTPYFLTINCTIMSVKSKYQAVLDLGENLGIQDGAVSEENGVLKVKGQAKTQYEKNVIWDKIKEIGGEQPADIMANITVADDSVYHRHVVQSGESLSKIAKHYYGDPMKYKQIFEVSILHVTTIRSRSGPGG